MIKYIQGDIFTSPAQVIVNAVNTVGVMGKGIALEFKNRYPKMFNLYKEMCDKHKFCIGKLMLCNEGDHQILLFPTKENWRNPSKIEYIEKGLIKFIQNYTERNIVSIAFPRLGCGNGELEWNDVKPLMEKYLKPLPIDVYIYEGINQDVIPEHKNINKIQEWLRENARDMSFRGVVDDIKYLCSLLPYSFTFNNEDVQLVYNNGLQFNGVKINIYINEDDFYSIWDSIRLKEIITSNDCENLIVYEMLASLNYIVKVKLIDNSVLGNVDAYQLNEGMERKFRLRVNNL